MQLTRNAVYHHDEYGEVLVIDVHHVFGEYDLETMEGTLESMVVRHTERWDDYGPMPTSVRRTPVVEFRTAVSEPLRTVSFVGPQEDPERS